MEISIVGEFKSATNYYAKRKAPKTLKLTKQDQNPTTLHHQFVPAIKGIKSIDDFAAGATSSTIHRRD
jgi:hypothetical protein